MRRGRGLSLPLTLLPTVAIVTLVAGWFMATSFNGYRSPIRERLPDSPPASPVSQQVVLFVVDGLRTDTSLRMPFLQSLAERGARGEMTSEASSFSQAAWTTLVTGAWPELNGAPPINAEGDQIRTIAVDSLFSSLRRAGMTSIICGHVWWSRMVPSDLLQDGSYVEGEDNAADEQVAAEAVRLLAQRKPNLALIHLDQMDWDSHLYGGVSREVEAAALRVDALIERVFREAALDDAVVIVVSDHGHRAQGGHGGDERDVLSEPFVMVGPSILAGQVDSIRQADVAPTVAVVLGAGIPSSCQGQPLLDALDIGVAERTEVLVNLSRQRIDLGNLYLNSIHRGALSETAEGDAAVAQSSIQVDNYDSAAKLAGYAVEQVDTEMDRARAARIADERGIRRIIALVAVVLPLFLLYKRRSVRTAVSLLAAVVAFGVFHLVFVWTGNTYSLSSMSAPVHFAVSSVGATVAGLLAGLLVVCAWLWHEKERAWPAVVRTTLGFVYLVLYLLWIVAAVAFYVNGLTTTWHLPHMGWAFVQLLTMAQIVLVALLGLALPWLAALINAAGPRALWWAEPRARTLWVRLRRRIRPAPETRG